MARLITYKDEARAQRVILFGGPKVGKTAMAGELANHFKLLYLDIEDSIDTLYQTCTDEALANIEYVPIRDSAKNPVAVTTLLKMWEDTKGWICHDHGAWKCPLCTSKQSDFFQIDLTQLTPANGWVIVIDSGTQFGHSAFFKVCNDNKIDLTDGEKASFAIWGAQGAYIDRLFTMVQACTNHVLLIAHEQEVEMVDKTKKIVPSMGTRKVASNFGKYFGHVIRLTTSAQGHKGVSLTGQPSAATGSRWGLDISDPNISICDFFNKPENLRELALAAASKKRAPKLGAKPAAKPAATPASTSTSTSDLAAKLAALKNKT